MLRIICQNSFHPITIDIRPPINPTRVTIMFRSFIIQLCFALRVVSSEINPNQWSNKIGNETINLIPSEKQENGLTRFFLMDFSDSLRVPKWRMNISSQSCADWFILFIIMPLSRSLIAFRNSGKKFTSNW